MKKMRKMALGFVKTGVISGIGANVLSEPSISGTQGAIQGKAALGNLTSMMPMMGTIGGAGAVLRGLNAMQPKKKRKR